MKKENQSSCCNPWNCIRFVFYFFLLLVCLYNVFLIVERNWLIPKLITRIDYESPKILDFPAITICAPVIVAPYKIAEIYPDFNESYQSWLNRSKRTGTAAQEEEFKKYESLFLNRYSVFDVINDQGVNPKDLDLSCHFKPINYRYRNHKESTLWQSVPCQSYSPILPTIFEGHKCFTFFSDLFRETQNDWKTYLPNISHYKDLMNHWLDNLDLSDSSKFYLKSWNQPIEKVFKIAYSQMYFDLNPIIELRIKIDQNLFGYLQNGQIFAIVHPPNLLPKAHFQRVTISSEFNYEVAITKRTTNWNTFNECQDYFDNYDGNRMNLTRDQFVNSCIRSESYNKTRYCFNQYSTINLLDMSLEEAKARTICEYHHKDFTTYLHAKKICSSYSRACTEVNYEVRGRAQTIHNYFDKFQDCSRIPCYSTIWVRLSPRPLKTITYLMPSTKEELYGTIGGHAGIWLGLSLYTLINFGITRIYNAVRSFLDCIWTSFTWKPTYQQ